MQGGHAGLGEHPHDSFYGPFSPHLHCYPPAQGHCPIDGTLKGKSLFPFAF